MPVIGKGIKECLVYTTSVIVDGKIVARNLSPECYSFNGSSEPFAGPAHLDDFIARAVAVLQLVREEAKKRPGANMNTQLMDVIQVKARDTDNVLLLLVATVPLTFNTDLSGGILLGVYSDSASAAAHIDLYKQWVGAMSRNDHKVRMSLKKFKRRYIKRR